MGEDITLTACKKCKRGYPYRKLTNGLCKECLSKAEFVRDGYIWAGAMAMWDYMCEQLNNHEDRIIGKNHPTFIITNYNTVLEMAIKKFPKKTDIKNILKLSC